MEVAFVQLAPVVAALVDGHADVVVAPVVVVVVVPVVVVAAEFCAVTPVAVILSWGWFRRFHLLFPTAGPGPLLPLPPARCCCSFCQCRNLPLIWVFFDQFFFIVVVDP